MKKLISALLTAAFAATMLFGCENVSYEVSRPETGESSADPHGEVVDILPPPINETSRTEALYVCRMLTDNADNYTYGEDTPSMIENLMTERDKVLSERYNIELHTDGMSYDEIVNVIKNGLEESEDVADLISLPLSDAVKMYTAGLLYDFRKLPDFNVETPIFDPENAKALATYNSLYLLPDPSGNYFDDVNVLFYNRELIDPSIGDPEELVEKGEWTWDKFTEFAKAASDLNAGKFGYALYYEEDEAAYPIWMSAGKRIVSENYGNKVAIDLDPDVMGKVAVDLTKHYNVSYIYPERGEDAENAFEAGVTPFLFNKFKYIYALRDGSEKGEKYGFLPMPKYEASQEGYSCLAGREARVLAIPATAKLKSQQELSRLNQLVSTICGIQGKNTAEAHVGTVLMNYLFTNEETVVLKIITQSVKFDFCWAFSNLGAVSGATIRAVCDYILFGSHVQNTVRMYKPSFDHYAEKHFNAESSENP